MLTSAFCTTAPIVAQGHGGGQSSYWELEALKETTLVRQVIVADENLNGRYGANPFMFDYLAALKVKQKVAVAIFNGAPWGATLRALRPMRTIVDVPANDNALSRDEFKVQGLEYPYDHQYDPALWPVYSLFIKEADVVIVQAKMSIPLLNVETKRVEVVPGGCQIPPEVKPFSAQFRVGYIGATGPDKGLPYLIKAWGSLMYRDAELILAGAGTEQLTPQVSQFPRTNYRLCGRLPDAGQLYDDISIYVQPSVTEGFGLPVLEAMAHGRPVIVTQGAGVHELVTEGVDGFIVPIRRPDEIADRIRWYAENPAKGEEMGKAARKKAEQYTWERAKKEYERIVNA